MADKRDDKPAISDQTTKSSEKEVADGSTQALLKAVWDDQAKIGIGPHAKIPQEYLIVPPLPDSSDTPVLRPLESVPVREAASGSPVDALFARLPQPRARILSSYVLKMEIFPTLDPFAKKAGLNLEGKF